MVPTVSAHRPAARDRGRPGVAPTVTSVKRRRILRPLLPFLLLLGALVPVAVSASATVRITAVIRRDDGTLALEGHVVSRDALDAEVARLLAEPRVLAAGPVHERSLVGRVTGGDPLEGSQWGWRRLGGPELARLGDGSGLVVAVLDTGVDASHPDLAGRVLPGWDSMDPEGDGRSDPNGHGTHVAGIIGAASGNGEGISGVAPGVQILPVRVLDATGNGDDDELAFGIIWAVDNGADIVNLSIGGAIPSTLLEGAIDHAVSNGVLVVVAAGNDGATGNAPSYPAAYRQVLAVGSTDASDRRSMFSNTGEYLDIAAPGSWIVSTWPGGRYQSSSGTSMAAPFVAGAAALLQSRTGLRGNELASRLVAGATDLGAAGADVEYGAGLVNPLAEVGIVPSPIPVDERTPVIPGLPALPPMPALPERVLPALPSLPEVTLPSVPRPTLPSLPSPSAPSSPVLPGVTVPGTPQVVPGAPQRVSPPRASDVRQTVGLVIGPVVLRAGGVREVKVSLEGARPLVVRQRLVVSVGAYRREVLTGWDGAARVRIPADRAGVLRVEFLGSPAVRPVVVEQPFSRR